MSSHFIPSYRIFFRLLLPALLLVVCAISGHAEQTAWLTPEVQVPVPDNWILLADSTGLPAQMMYINDSAEILIFQSRISGEDQISNEIELKKSVDLVIDEVILSLPDGQVLTSSGFYDKFRTGFTLEFMSTDSASLVPIEHSLRGIIYRHPDDYQLLFTVWGQATASVFPIVKDAIEEVQAGLVYGGEIESEVFAPPPISYWPVILVIMAVIGLILVRPPWKRREPKKPAPDITGTN